MNDDVFADVKAAAGNIDPEYLQERWRRANSDAVRSPDGATLALKDSTGISLTGPAHEVGRAYGAIIAATCPDSFRGEPEPAPTTNWDAHRAAARARQDAKAGGVTEAARKKLEAL